MLDGWGATTQAGIMARYYHKETTESGIAIYTTRIERPRPMVRTGGAGLIRRPPSREPSIEVACPEDLRRLTEGK